MSYTYQSLPERRLKKWQVGVIEICEFSFPQKKKKKVFKLKSTKPKGIDLNLKHEEVKKLFMKHCAKMCIERRCDPQDVLQEVYKGILIRNKGKCPFDETKSAFSTYIVMVSKCVTINYINKMTKKREREVYGKETSIESEDYLISQECNSHLETEGLVILKEARASLKKHLVGIFDDLLQGYKVSHISKKRSMDTRKVNKYIEDIRRTLRPYEESLSC